MKKNLILAFASLSLVLFSQHAHGQISSKPLEFRSGGLYDVDLFVIKGDNKTHVFEMDTTSVDYKSFSRVDPDWIQEIQVLNEDQLQGGKRKVLIVTLKKDKVNALPEDMKSKFH